MADPSEVQAAFRLLDQEERVASAELVVSCTVWLYAARADEPGGAAFARWADSFVSRCLHAFAVPPMQRARMQQGHAPSLRLGSMSATTVSAMDKAKRLALLQLLLSLAMQPRGAGDGDAVLVFAYDARACCVVHCVAQQLSLSSMARQLEVLFSTSLSAPQPDPEQGLSTLGFWRSDVGRYLQVAAAGAIGGAALFITGGLAAPAIAATFSALGASAAVVPAGATVAAAFGASGAAVAGSSMHKRTSDVADLTFECAGCGTAAQACLYVPGWFVPGEGSLQQFSRAVADGSEKGAHADVECACDVECAVWEEELLLAFGDSLSSVDEVIKDQATSYLASSALAATIGTALASAIALPVTLLAAASVLDHPWSMGMQRADRAGELLAQQLLKVCCHPQPLLVCLTAFDHDLMQVRHGSRPISLVGYSMGARVIFRCLQVLIPTALCILVQQLRTQLNSPHALLPQSLFSAIGADAAGIVRHVCGAFFSPGSCSIDTTLCCRLLLGAPVCEEPEAWAHVRSCVSGCIYNCYSRKDFVLGTMYARHFYRWLRCTLQLLLCGCRADSLSSSGIEFWPHPPAAALRD